jgi:multiple sugar transport system substrate-binding protein
VENLLFKALAKKTEDRYADMDAFIVALESLYVGQTSPVSFVAAPPKALQPDHATQTTLDSVDEPPASIQTAQTALPSLTATLPSRSTVQPAWKRFWLVGLALVGMVGILLVGYFILGNVQNPGIPFSLPTNTVQPATPVSTKIPTQKTKSAPTTAQGERVKIRWFIGLGTGTNPDQIPIQEEVVRDFNAYQDKIELILEIVPYDNARDTLATQISSGNAPDVIGPVGWAGSNAFYGQWLDLAPYIYDPGFTTAIFNPALVKAYQTDEGQVGLPFAIYPAATFYVPAYFDRAGLAYPPARYGEKYTLDGKKVEWNWDTLAKVARRLTIDRNGRNATEAGFDRTRIVQVGFSLQWQTHVNYAAAYRAGAADIVEGNAKGKYKVAFPDDWKAAIKWYYDGMYGAQPFIATGQLVEAPEFGNSNLFNSGKAAMAISPIWYTCCLADFAKSGLEFQAGALPVGDDGKVHGRVDADTFRIWKGSKRPMEAFIALRYLITIGGEKLLPAYGAMPAVTSETKAFFDRKSQEYPFVKPESWEIFKAGQSYPDNPSAEQYQPNWDEAWAREQEFSDLIQYSSPSQLNFNAEWQKLINDLNIIYNK